MSSTNLPVFGNLRIDGDRLWDSIMQSARIGGTAKGGIRRLALSDLDRQVRDWFVQQCRQAGCSVRVDDLGNIFARRPGRDDTLPPIAIGSHLDTQPSGGKFDGIIGVLAGLEVLRSLNDAGVETHAPIEVIDWTNEEGSRFAPAMLASGVFAGVFSKQYAYDRTDRDGMRFGDELARIGYAGDAACGDHRLSACFELHIEQGPVLEAEGRTIGIVTGVQGIRWFEVTVTGADCHAGTTPIPLRQDALLAAARMIQAVRSVALGHAPDAVGTVGLIEARPNSRNVIPGEVFFTIDIRHPDDAVVAAMDAELRQAIQGIAAAAGVAAAVALVWESPAVHFDAGCVAAVAHGAAALGHPARRIVSGAGHDAAYVARVAPTAMIFVPCAGGVSHNELESAEAAHVTAGANVLLHAVLETDARLFGPR
jgi:N-carbamoyl-L-amino-acid hydrolase